MTTSEKLKLIKEIGKELSNEDWGIIDLTLKEFNFKTADFFSGEKNQYVIQQIKVGKEKQLIDLAEYINIDNISKVSDINPTFWKDGYLKLFISHLATDKRNAIELKKELETYAISGFVAHSDIDPTSEWQDEIELALNTCDSLVALMIDGFHESNWTDQEIGFAMGRDLLIIPVRMGYDPFGFIGKFQAITYNDIPNLADDIFESLAKNKKTSKKMSYAMMYKFENSVSFINAKQNLEYVARLNYWDKKLIRKLEAASEMNSQISGSFGMPKKIANLIRRIKYD